MGNVIGQRWEVYDYEDVEKKTLEKGEKIVVKGTPDFGEAIVELISPDKARTVADIYADWKDGVGSPFRTSVAQDEKDKETLEASKEYTNNSMLAKPEWLSPVNTAADLPRTGLNNKQNYLCGVVADPVKSGIYQVIQGWESEPIWELFNSYVDFVNEQELERAVENHNKDKNVHEDIREAITRETEARTTADSGLRQTISAETRARENTDNILQAQIDGVNTISLTGALLTRIVNGVTEVPKNLFFLDTVFVSNKTLINDVDGTIGVYTGDINPAAISVITVTTAPVGTGESINLGIAQTNADLPLTADDAVTMWGRTPRINDYATVQVDETMLERRVEWYITDIIDGIITWGNPVPINTADYQQQTTAADEGLVLTGGKYPGTFGKSMPVDVQVVENGVGIPTTVAVFTAIKEIVLETFYPVNKIYMTTDPANPGTYMGGTWIEWGQGRVPVGVDTSQNEFNEVEKTGGEKVHALTIGEMPSHSHNINGEGTQPMYSFTSGTKGGVSGPYSTDSRGGNQPHNNLQPFITCYMFKRTV